MRRSELRHGINGISGTDGIGGKKRNQRDNVLQNLSVRFCKGFRNCLKESFNQSVPRIQDYRERIR
jgi:hypothetical protein